jgi:hypothetical protein
VSESTYSKDFEKLINCKDFSDVQIELITLNQKKHISETSVLFCHKIFLSRSEKFQHHFASFKEKENVSSLQLVEKISKEAFLDILRFLYTSHTSSKIDNAQSFQNSLEREILESGKPYNQKETHFMSNDSIFVLIFTSHISDPA